MTETKRIMVVANKHWEVDPLVNVILNDRAVSNKTLGPIEIINHPFFMRQRKTPDPVVRPRIEINGNGRKANARLEVWCVQDLMNPKECGSSTHEKVRVLDRAFDYEDRSTPDLVIAFGTAAGLPGGPGNGSVVVGSSVFIHDPFAEAHNPDEHWKPPRPDRIIPCGKPPNLVFKTLRGDLRLQINAHLLRPPLQTADPLIGIAGEQYVALSNVNITDYNDYGWADEELLESFSKVAQGRLRIGSLETTHGVIREIAGESPEFMYVSGIANAIGCFDTQNSPRRYSQNFAAAHNAGVTLALLIPKIL